MKTYMFHNNKLLLDSNDSIPLHYDGKRGIPFICGNNEQCRAVDVETVPDGFHAIDLRSSYDVLPLADYLCAGKAAELLNWNSNHQFCGKCGSRMTSVSSICKTCPQCGTEIWPMLSTAIIVLIYDDSNRILLVKSKSVRGSYYGLVAGFVELGESVEDAVVREVSEETNLDICDVKYFGSQPWPYPQGLMLGFTARYKGGQLRLQQSELRDGGWFDIHSLPEIPKPLSMARKLIDRYLATVG